MVPGAGLEPAREKLPRDFKSLASTISATRAVEMKVYQTKLNFFLNGGATRIRTGDQGFAGPCLSHLAMAPWSGLRDSNPRPPPWQGGALAS